MNRMIVCGVVALLAVGSVALPHGAPDGVCDDPLMEPTHHVDIYGSTDVGNTNKYTLTTKAVQGVSNQREVTLSGGEFKGFVVRATTRGEKNVGKFIKNEAYSAFNKMTCSNVTDVAVTHTSALGKPSITLLWQDGNQTAKATFQATVVLSKTEHVMNIFES